MNNSIRCFLAIKINGTLRELLKKILADFVIEFPNCVKWVPLENIHITIKFIGNLNTTHMDALQVDLSNALASLPVFQIESNQIGAFPNIKNPRIIWLGIRYPIHMKHTFSQIETILKVYGYPVENRPFKPHLTLGRVKKNVSLKDLLDISCHLSSYKLNEVGSMRAKDLTLFKSTLTPDGPFYEELFQFSFATK